MTVYDGPRQRFLSQKKGPRIVEWVATHPTSGSVLRGAPAFAHPTLLIIQDLTPFLPLCSARVLSHDPKETVTTVTVEKLTLLRLFCWSFLRRLLSRLIR